MSNSLKALLSYQQADEEGVMVLASRQAIHEVCDELVALRADDWQPIETAPMSNIRLLLYVPPYGVMTGNGTLDVNDVFFWKLHACLNKNAVPTHWKPLPAPPTLSLEKSK